MNEIKLKNPKGLTRRKFLRRAGTSLAGVAVAGNMGVMFAGCTPFRQQGSGTASSDIQMPKWPFNYKKIDPEKAARLGYEFYKEGG